MIEESKPPVFHADEKSLSWAESSIRIVLSGFSRKWIRVVYDIKCILSIEARLENDQGLLTFRWITLMIRSAIIAHQT